MPLYSAVYDGLVDTVECSLNHLDYQLLGDEIQSVLGAYVTESGLSLQDGESGTIMTSAEAYRHRSLTLRSDAYEDGRAKYQARWVSIAIS